MDRLTTLTILDDWNFWNKEIDTGIERKAQVDEISRLSKIGEIVVIKGVRRSGKSTLLLQFCRKLIDSGVKKEDFLIINFEDPRWGKLTLSDLNAIYEIYLTELQPSPEHYVILDEVQTVDGWEKFGRYLLESKKAKVFVTGSSSKLLSAEYSTVISGRHLDLTVNPLSFKEYLFFKGLQINKLSDLSAKRHQIKKFFNEYLQWGGFPKITLLTDERDKKNLLEAYFQDIIIKDAVKRYKIKEVEKFEELAKFYLSNVSKLQSFNSLKNILNLSLDTIERFSSYLSSVYLLSFEKKFSYSQKEQLLNPRKVYAVDNGLRNAVSFVFSKDFGRLAENMVFNYLVQEGLELYYWKEGSEADFIVKKGAKVKAVIQVCWDLSDPETKKRELKGLIASANKLKLKEGLVLTEDYSHKEKVGGLKITYLPIWQWLLGFKG